jgi:L-lactate dehydrogenase
MKFKQRKVVVIGAGAVGTTYIYALLQHSLATEIALVDIDRQRLEGEVMDLSHGLPFIAPVEIHAGSYDDCTDANLIVLTAGAKQTPGQSRIDLVRKNAEMLKAICKQIKSRHSKAVIVVVTNPVDVLTQLAIQQLRWPRQRIIGSGTVLDSSRFKYLLSRHCGVDARNVHAYVLGEHGDSEVAAWSMTHIAGVPVRKYCPACRKCAYEKCHADIAEMVRDSAYHIIDYKGSTYYGIGLSLVRISEAILRNENSVLTVSVLLQGEYGLRDVCLSVPCVIDANGVQKIIDAPLNRAESEALKKSARTLMEIFRSIKNRGS